MDLSRGVGPSLAAHRNATIVQSYWATAIYERLQFHALAANIYRGGNFSWRHPKKFPSKAVSFRAAPKISLPAVDFARHVMPPDSRYIQKMSSVMSRWLAFTMCATRESFLS
jgi:hypothetical protein